MLHQKRSELLRLLFIVSMLALTIGVIFVYSSAASPTQTSVPKFVKGSNDTTFNFSVSVLAGNNVVQRVDVNRPTASPSFSVINCPVNIPAGWACEKISSNVLSFTDAVTGIVAGGTTNFSVNATASGTSGNSSWIISTFETTGGTGANTTERFNVTIDADAPLIYNGSMNLSDGNVTLLNSSSLAWPGGWVKLQDLTFNVTITDTVYDNVVNASIYYNVSNTTTPQAIFSVFPHPDTFGSYSDVIVLTSQNPATGRYNGTLAASALANGTIVTFTIVANDSVGNRNVSNLTTNTYNFTVDGASPLLVDAPNITNEQDAKKDNITTSSAWLNISIIVNDFGGSGVSRVELNASATQGWVNMTQLGTSSTWNYTGALTSLGVPFGDQNLTIHFRAFDNVSNVNGSIATFNILVDDDAPQFAIGLFSPANTTEEVLRQNFTTSNTSVLNFSIIVYGNLNTTVYSNSTPVTIMGPNDIVYNLSLLSRTTRWGGIGNDTEFVYASTWFSAQSPQSGGAPASSLNSTNSTLNTLGCGQISPDGGVCQIRINATDIFGRNNFTNISITFDNVSASTTNFTNNATGGAIQVVRSGSIINFSVSASNNIQNVTIHASGPGNQTLNGTLMTSRGNNNYSIIVGADAVCGPSEGTCTVNFSTVDKALNINRSGIAGAKAQGASTTFIVDNSAPVVSSVFLVNGTTNTGPEVVAGTGAARVYRSDIALNITFNVSDQITNVTQVNIGNATLRNASLVENGLDGYNNVSTLASFGCTAGVESECILRVHASDNESIDSLRNSNTTVNLTFRVDDLKPRVANFTTNLTYNHRVTSATILINFTVNVTDANLVNVSVANTTIILMNRSSAATTSNSTSVVWTVATTLDALGCTANGNCSVTVYANDSAGNVNASQWISVNLDNTALSTVGMNISPATGTSNPISDNTPTLWINLTSNSLCSYSTTQVPYADMTAMGGAGTPSHSTTLAAQSDGTYTYYFRCVDNLNVEPSNFLQRTTFTIDTINDTVISIDNSTQNVVFYFDNTPTITVNLSANALCRYSNSTSGVLNYTTMKMPFDVNGTRHNSFTLATTADGSYTYPIACATANEQNVVTGTVTFTVDTVNDTIITITNFTNTGSTFIAATPTVHVNLSNSSTCRYSNLTSTNTVFNDMTMPFDVNGTRLNSFTVSGDLRDNDYAYPVACTTANGQNEVRETVRFAVDTTSLWNVTIGATGSLSAAKDYFTQANKFYTFRMPKTNVLATTAVNTRYNVTDVLASVMGSSPGTAATNNLSVIWAYNRTGDVWTSFVFGRTTNTFTNFTSDVMDYYINLTVANERIEIN